MLYSVRRNPYAVYPSGISYFCFVVPSSFPNGDLTSELTGFLGFPEVPDPHVPDAVLGSQNFQKKVLVSPKMHWN